MKNKPVFLFLFLGCLSVMLQAQVVNPFPQKIFPEQDKDAKYYTVSGFRHGVSFFPKVKYAHVQYEPSETLTFDTYHSADVIYHWMNRWAEDNPGLVDLYVVDYSYEGRPIYQMTLTNKETGKATDKPAAFFEGNRHSGEVSSAESVLWLIHYLIGQYGKDPEITAILDKNTIYLRPINNPDGHNLYMHTAQSNRSTVRPFDNDGDGLLDEDSPEDIDGDGLVLRMRYKDAEKGDYIIDPRDSTGRVMKRVPVGEGEYCMAAEGIDNDGDGRINEDGIGGLDLHRNYAENWRPAKEATGRGWTQGGAGEYPLSEVETRSVFTFLLTHPHIYVVNSMDTRVPMHLRAPSTSPTSAMFPEDSQWYLLFDKIGKEITGYKRAGDVYQDYGNGSPLFGHGPDFGYWYYGSIWYGDEIWDGGEITTDYNGDGVIDELDKLIWDEKENDGMGFTNWKPYKHPDLGEVEIGGWDPKFYAQNSPSKQIEKWAKNQALFNLAMVKHLPELEWDAVEVKRVKKYKNDSTDYQVKVSYKNVGALPTALRQADHVKIVKPDQIVLALPDSLVSGAQPIARILPEAGIVERPERGRSGSRGPQSRTTRNAGYAQGGETNSRIIQIRVYGEQEIEGTVSVQTTRAGILPQKKFV
ncbi:M14 family metallopeptidase, partial [Parabacteroides sp. OttesenSCG-928-K15]|nr:M14 family metallopeptidase [Parabacteroides sp. OttesenSCG-928-K15]